ncbi:hypothetical protein [Leptospira sp. GIMC2001]|uniref:hypothetical protein n=1 Tax=Leptospira sp. GIMC2001 TaxID=1513297 RepID=UPI00234A028E|nr:hypothetical protein [Leptospira sp. GIMC2001]WCL50805.1 hypothetical protein O4O04_08330 [Leptospira sp. GIMC2001]
MKKIIFILIATTMSCAASQKGYKSISPQSRIIVKNDKIEDRSIYTHEDFVGYFSKKSIELYIIKMGKKKYLRIVFSYTGNDWIFFERMILSGVNEKIEYSIDSFDKFTNVNSNASVIEKADLKIEDAKLKVLKNIFSNSFTLRLSGKYYTDEEYRDCDACLELIDFYEKLD